MLATASPLTQYTDRDGSPLDEGYLYFGLPDQNPETAPTPVFWDREGTQPVAQPVRTIGGFPARFGAAARLYIATGDYSLTIYTKRRELVGSYANVRQGETESPLSGTDGAGLIGFAPLESYLPGSVGERLTQTLTVNDYGATGDGTTDDTAAFLAAAATGNPVILRDGTYVLSNAAWPTSVRLVGQGMGKTVLRWKGGSGPANMIGLSGVVDFRAEGITFDGNRAAQTDTTGYYGTVGGTISNGSRVVFERCEFLSGRISDIYISGPTTAGEWADVEITRCRFTDGLVGTVTRAAQSVGVSQGIRLKASGNIFYQPALPTSYGRAGIVMQRPAGSTATAWGRVIADGNEFTNVGYGKQAGEAILGAIYVYSGSELNTVTGNIFRDAVGSAVTVKSDCGNTTITGNSVYGSWHPSSAALCFFDQADTLTSSLGRDLVITGNTVRGAELQSIFVNGSRLGFSNFRNIIIANNACDGGGRGITFRNVDTARVSGNSIVNTTGIGIFVDGPIEGDIVISDNTIATGLVGIDINGTATTARIAVASNRISNLTGGAVQVRQSCESFHISDNEIATCTTAFTTVGATQPSTITDNKVRGETAVWSRSGTYSGAVVFDRNLTSAALAFSTRNLTIATGAITVFADWHYVDTEGAAATDDLDTINGGFDGRRLLLMAANNARDVVLKDGTGNLRLNGDFALTHSEDVIELIYIGSVWREVSRSDNTV